MTPYAPRHLDWPDCLNARDLGGMPTRDGRRLRPGALIRSDRHSRLTADGVAAVRAAGVNRIVDLRMEHECAAEPSPLADSPYYVNAAWVDIWPGMPAQATVGELYLARLDQQGERIGAAVAEVADAPAGGVVVHCAIGKDRTGLVIALLLEVVGVDTQQIANDYALSQPRLAASFAEELAGISDPERRARLLEGQRSDPEFILGALAHVYDRYGGAEHYLLRHGVTADQLGRLRARLLDGAA